MYDKRPLSPALREIIKISKQEASRLGRSEIFPEHYLLAIIRHGKGIAFDLLLNFTPNIDALIQKLELIKRRARMTFSPSKKALAVYARAKCLADEMGNSVVETQHLLLALLSVSRTDDPPMAKIVAESGIDVVAVKEGALRISRGETISDKNPRGDRNFVFSLGEVKVSDTTLSTLLKAREIAKNRKSEAIEPSDILLAILVNNREYGSTAKALGMDPAIMSSLAKAAAIRLGGLYLIT